LTTHDFLYLAVTKEVSQSVFEEEAGQTMIEDGIIRLVIFDGKQEVLVRWIP
jgi:XisH protein